MMNEYEVRAEPGESEPAGFVPQQTVDPAPAERPAPAWAAPESVPAWAAPESEPAGPEPPPAAELSPAAPEPSLATPEREQPEAAPPELTGHPMVDASLRELAMVAGAAPADQLPAFQAAHRTLHETLASIDEG